MRFRKEKNIEEKLSQYRGNLLFEKKELKEILSDKKNIYLEIGMGKGDFILEMAEKNPDNFYVGLEKRGALILRAIRKIKQQKNVLFIVSNIDDFEDSFEDVFDGIFLNFSDPWPKKRHYKRRLVYRNYMDLYDKILKKGSTITFKTDNSSLFSFALEEIAETNRTAFDVSHDIYSDSRYLDNVPTEYEKKFHSMGLKIKGLKFYSS